MAPELVVASRWVARLQPWKGFGRLETGGALVAATRLSRSCRLLGTTTHPSALASASASTPGLGLRSLWTNIPPRTRSPRQHLHFPACSPVHLGLRYSSTSTSTSSTAISSSTPSPPSTAVRPRTARENIYTLPNLLTVTRLAAAPAVGYFILTLQPLAALGLFMYAGITDLVDGYLARRFNSGTVVGSVIDPMADKLLMATCVLSLGYVGTFPLWLVVVIFGRDVGFAISAIWWRYISLPPPKTFLRYWDFSLPSAQVHPTEISKINTLLQLLLVGNAMVLPVLPEAWTLAWNLWGIQQGWEYLVAATTVWSGLSYVGNKDAVRIVAQPQPQQPQQQQQEAKGGEARG